MLEFSSSLSLKILAGEHLGLTLGPEALDPGGARVLVGAEARELGGPDGGSSSETGRYSRSSAVTHAAAEPREPLQ